MPSRAIKSFFMFRNSEFVTAYASFGVEDFTSSTSAHAFSETTRADSLKTADSEFDFHRVCV